MQIDKAVDSILESIEKEEVYRYSTRAFEYLAKICLLFGKKKRKFLILNQYLSKLEMVEDEELVKALLDNLVESEDWKVAFLLCRLISKSSSLRLSASKYVLKTPLAKEIGKLVYNNIDDFTLTNFIVEFIGRAIPQRKVTVGDPFISRLWGIYDPVLLWKEFPFRAMAGDQKTIEYIKKVAMAYINNNRSEQSRPRTNFMPMVCLNISGIKYSFQDENHIILQIKDQSIFLWYPTANVNAQSANCPLELLEIDLASLAKPPATAPLNITLYFESRVHHREYAAIDTTTTRKQLKLTLFPPSIEAEQDLIDAITTRCALPLLSLQRLKEQKSKTTNTDSSDKKPREKKTVSRSLQLIATKNDKTELAPNTIDDQLAAEETTIGSMNQFVNYSPEDVNETVDPHTSKAKRKTNHIPDSQQPPTKKKLVTLPQPTVQKNKPDCTIPPSLSQELAASTLPSPDSSNQSMSTSQPKETLSQQQQPEEPEYSYERDDNPVIILDDDDYYQLSQNFDNKAPEESEQATERKQPAPTPPPKVHEKNENPVLSQQVSRSQTKTLPTFHPAFEQQPQKTPTEQHPPNNQPLNPSSRQEYTLPDHHQPPRQESTLPLPENNPPRCHTLSDYHQAVKPLPQNTSHTAIPQPREPVPFPPQKQPLFNHSLLHDELEEINNQIYSSLKSGSRQIIKRLQRVQNILNPENHSLFLSKYYQDLHEIQTKRQNIKASLTTFVATNKWSPVDI
ncbi:hypothetical protein TRICI_000081 [Trichomonascus ciferrii]|uniref:Uncharacterized protein n=1 Tax=Trichomonascus ciferrii TaxID=44093 RepID=A0A642VEH0_9ASCO|nr:hypothetical protein TRICI_000081 [Trichomonascus ciferrii]